MDATKRCSTCQQVRPLTDFNRRAKALDGRQARCRSCARDWYAAHGVQHRLNVRRRTVAIRSEYKRRIGEHLRNHPCVDCGESNIRVLDFDHDVGTEKKADIALLVTAGGRWSDIEAEISKCSVRCANCHRRVTSKAGSGLAAPADRLRCSRARPDSRPSAWPPSSLPVRTAPP